MPHWRQRVKEPAESVDVFLQCKYMRANVPRTHVVEKIRRMSKVPRPTLCTLTKYEALQYNPFRNKDGAQEKGPCTFDDVLRHHMFLFAYGVPYFIVGYERAFGTVVSVVQSVDSYV